MRTLICEFQGVTNFMEQEFVDTTFMGEHLRVPVRSGRKTPTPDRQYGYAYVGDKKVTRGDWALVHNGAEFGIVEIKRVIPGIEPKVTKHVIEVLTKKEFEAYLERNKKIDEMRSELDNLDYMLEQRKKMKKYEELAEDSPEAAKILERLRTFFGMNTTPAIEATPSASAPIEETQGGGATV